MERILSVLSTGSCEEYQEYMLPHNPHMYNVHTYVLPHNPHMYMYMYMYIHVFLKLHVVCYAHVHVFPCMYTRI